MRSGSFSYPFHLGMSSVDHAGVLYFPEVFRHAHDAYEAFMASLDHDLASFFEAGRLAIPVVHAGCDFRNPMRHGDNIQVRVQVERLGESSMTLDYEFIGPDGKLCATASTVHVFVDRADGRSVSIPASLRDRLQSLMVTES